VPSETVGSSVRRGQDGGALRLVAGACLAAWLLTACTSNHPAPTSSGSGSSTSPNSSGSSPAAAVSVSSAAPAGGSTSTGAASASPTQLPAASSSNAPTALPAPGPTGPLAIFADVSVKGAFSTAQSGLVAAQGPDGAVFVAGVAPPTTQPQVIWVVDGVQPAAVAEHVTGPVTALAADTTNVYVGISSSIYAYSRTTGALVHRWLPTALAGSGTQVTQLAIAGDRLWGLFTESADAPTGAPGGLVEIDPTSTSMVRTISGITGAFSFAAGSAGVYYVTKQSSQLVEQTNNGDTISVPTHQSVNLQLSGPSAIQAVAVVGDQVVLQHDAGQGLDAVLNTYDAGSLAGPSPAISFSAAEQLVSTPSGLLVIGNPDTGACAAGQQTCVRRFSLSGGSGGNVGDSLALPDDTLATTLTGPYPTVVLGAGSDLHVLRIS
jgi:hypothetical protein